MWRRLGKFHVHVPLIDTPTFAKAKIIGLESEILRRKCPYSEFF